jgi:hypothetical protein
MVRPNTKVDDQARHGVYLERKKVQRSIRKCIKRHKDKFRLQLSNMVVRGEDKVAAQAAISVLGKGYDLGLVRGKEAKLQWFSRCSLRISILPYKELRGVLSF